MSFGVDRVASCGCGYPVTVTDYTVDPPPIPVVPGPDVSERDDLERRLHECPRCGRELDGAALLETVA